MKAVILFQKRKKFSELLKTIREDFWPLDAFNQLETFLFIIKGLQYLVVLYCISGILVPEILMYFPYIDDIPGQRILPLLCVYPYDSNKTPYYELTYAWFITSAFWVGLGIPGFDLLFIYLQVNIILQFRLLKYALSTLNTNYDEEEMEEKLYQRLVFCIKYHKKLIKFFSKTKEMYEFHNAIELLAVGLAVVCITYLLQNEQDPVKLVKLCMYYFCALLNVSIYCLTGSLIQSEIEDLPFAIYNTGWEKRSKRFQKSVLFMMQVAQIPRNITAGKLFELNNMTLITIFKTAFSVAILLSDKNQEV